MTDKAPLVGGVLHDSGTFYLLVETDDADDDESVVAVGHAEGDRIVLNELTGLEEIASMICLSADWAVLGQAACLTAEGLVYFLTPSGAQPEIVPGSGYSRDDSRGLGRMTTLGEASGWLFAMGFGGQVYRRRVDSGWEDIGVRPLSDMPPSPPSLLTVAPGPAPESFVFGGLNVSEYEDTDEIEAADEEDDSDRLAELILAAVGDDTLTIRMFNGTWTENEFDVEGIAAPILVEGASSWLIFVSTGTIWRTSEFRSFEEVFATEQPQDGWGDVKQWNGRPLVLNDDSLFVLQGNTLVDFPDPLPTQDTSCLSVSPSAAGLAAVHRNVVQLYDGTSWSLLTPVLG